MANGLNCLICEKDLQEKSFAREMCKSVDRQSLPPKKACFFWIPQKGLKATSNPANLAINSKAKYFMQVNAIWKIPDFQKNSLPPPYNPAFISLRLFPQIKEGAFSAPNWYQINFFGFCLTFFSIIKFLNKDWHSLWHRCWILKKTKMPLSSGLTTQKPTCFSHKNFIVIDLIHVKWNWSLV